MIALSIVTLLGCNNTSTSKDNDSSTTTGPTEETPSGYQIAVGGEFACLLNKGTGVVNCWGTDNPLEADLTGVASMTAYFGAICTLDFQGHPQCWGGNSRPQEGVESVQDEFFSEIADAYYASCGLRKEDDSVVCWGDVEMVVLPDVPLEKMTGVGSYNFCALEKSTTRPQCWGSDKYGVVSQMPEDLPPLIGVAAGEYCTYAIQTDGRLVGWGDGFQDYYENYLDCQTDTPVGGFLKVATSTTYACGITVSGRVECWGQNTSPGEETPPPGGDDFVAIASQEAHSCAVHRDGRVECWGKNVPMPP